MPPAPAPDANPFRLRRAWVALLGRLRRRRSVILGYHGVARATLGEDPYRLQLAPERFRSQVEMMHEAGFRFVTVARLLDEAGGGTPPPGLAAVTFDDGLRNNLTRALPILAGLDAPATIYVPTGWIGARHKDLGPTEEGRILSVDEISQLHAAGWELGSHSVTHPDLSLLDYDGCLSEITRSAAELERITGVPVRTLAYPYGRYGEAAVRAARDAGLAGALTTGSASWEPFRLTRAMVGGADSFAVTLLKLDDRYEAVTDTAPARAWQAARSRVRERLRRGP